MVFLKKIHGNMTFSSRFLKRWSFQKGPRRDMMFLVLSGKMVFFLPETWYFFLVQEGRDDLSQEIHVNMIFPVYTYSCCKRGITPLCQKSQRCPYRAKIHLKVIDVLGWHPRKSSSHSQYFHGDLYRWFHVLLSSEKNSRNLIYRIEIWPLLQFIRLKMFYNE